MCIKITEHGWVMMDKKAGCVVAFTFHSLRRYAINEIQQMFPNYSRRQILYRWKPMKATRTVTVTL
jgi:hypothetical protein